MRTRIIAQALGLFAAATLAVPVMESGADGQRRLRGLLSAAQVRRVLGR